MRKLLVLLALSLSLTPLMHTSRASAANASDWQAGRIIDDAIFTNKNAMDASQIQTFLNSKLGSCDTSGTQIVSDEDYGDNVSRHIYGERRGNPSPFTCLKDYYEVPKTAPSPGIPESNYGGRPVPSGAKSAAQLIWDAAQAYNINPQVLLVTLQKEQSLLTDDWPFKSQFLYAMGANCPDSGPGGSANCDTNYAGFSLQMREGAELYRYYLDNMNEPWWPYAKPGYRNILYNVSQRESVCGRKSVLIETMATAALYTYTPYTPNQAAVNHLYSAVPGSSTDPAYWDGYCAAYGNRNFWRMFTDWFGSPLANKPASNVSWAFENLAGGRNSLSPTTNTVGLQPKAISYKDKLHVFYYDATQRVLKLSIDNAGWSHQILDGHASTNGRVIGDVGRAATAFVYDDMLHVFYYDATNAGLRHAWYHEANGWVFEAVDGMAGSISNKIANVGMSNVALEYAGGMHIFYYDTTNTNLRHAWYTPTGGWKFENLEGDFGSISGLNANVGQNPEALVHGGTVQLFYYDVSNGNLRHAWSSPTQAWKFENLDGDPGSVSHSNGNVGQDPSITIHGGGFQLFYYDVSNGNLRHAWASTTQPWKFENLEGDRGSVSGYNTNIGSMSEALSFKNNLYVFYRENSAGIARYAWADSSGWHFANLDGIPYSVSGLTSNTGFWPSAVGYGDSLQLYYFDNDQRALRHIFGQPYW